MEPVSPAAPGAPARSLSRRKMLRFAGAAGIVAPFALAAPSVFASGRFGMAHDPLAGMPICRVADDVPPPAGPPRHVKIAWSLTGVCNAALPVALQHGLFKKYNLDVELVNYGGFTDQLLEAISTGKADAGVGMALRWFKALEQGFDVRLTSGIHGGCMRMLVGKASGINSFDDLRGKTIAVGDTGGNSQNFFSIVMAKRGWDPNKDVTWRTFPSALLGVAVQKGEADALADGDPNGWILRKQHDMVEIATNMMEGYRERVCCVLGIQGRLLREDRAAAVGITRALLEGADITAHNPHVAAEAYQPYAPKISTDDLATLLATHADHVHPIGEDFRHQIALYADELKSVSVLKPSTDPVKFANKVYADVIS